MLNKKKKSKSSINHRKIQFILLSILIPCLLIAFVVAYAINLPPKTPDSVKEAYNNMSYEAFAKNTMSVCKYKRNFFFKVNSSHGFGGETKFYDEEGQFLGREEISDSLDRTIRREPVIKNYEKYSCDTIESQENSTP